MPCPDCSIMARRDFLERSLALLGVSALIACVPETVTTPSISSFTITLADFPALAAIGGIAVVDGGSHSGEPIAVARTAASTYVALSLICPHRGVTIEIVAPGFFCPGHGATFADNGAWTGGQTANNMGVYNSSYDPVAGTLKIG